MQEVKMLLPRADGVLPLWPLCLEVLRALGSHYYPVMEETALQAGMGECDWYLLLPALTFDPEPTTTIKLRVRHPYYAPHVYEGRLRKLAELGYLRQTEVLDTELHIYAYEFTESGRMTIQWIIRAADQAMEKLRPLKNGEMERLLSLLQRIVQASLDAPKPPHGWSLHLSRRLDGGADSPLMTRVDQALTDLFAYLDDCHLWAWRSQAETRDVTAPAWETLGVLWKRHGMQARGMTIEELHQWLERRGHPQRVYADALEEIKALGWAENPADGPRWRITEQGIHIRQQTQALGDDIFYRPWGCLSMDEMEELRQLLANVWDGLRVK